MKVLPSAPLTEEDCRIWVAVGVIAGVRHGMNAFWDNAEIEDRRDAELMLWAQTWRRFGSGLDHPPEYFCQGWSGLLVYRGEHYFGGSHYTSCA